MTPCHDSEREDDGPGGSRNLIPQRKKCAREDTDHPKREETDDESQPEPAQDSRDLDEEIRALDFLFRSTPRDVI